MSECVEFFVPGVPAPGGSKKAFVVNGRAVVKDDAKHNRGWRATVALAAREAMAGRPPLEGPLAMAFVFVQARPRGHFGTGRNAGTVRDSAPDFPATRPDALKLARSTEDALTGICYRDDAQTVALFVFKVYGDSPGCLVIARRLVAGEVARG
jgi:Holliday junction resolvase RusA-like endonuclease